ncbi:putative short chain dehydrogenase protein [Neofusicoccum parvum UCRNP2]|uniref:Short chain dehydrogenase protein n=2 Tax=Neofusicoccum parvum TaxID=310453 RepID=A0ACB5S1K5_9PEZI|nr:putative short chain dehydrogenase protein [Neofusicoccum parvum UCRNP2]GME26642.1 putative short chain dehydrogenase protein [Neofusicoccum parvum]
MPPTPSPALFPRALLRTAARPGGRAGAGAPRPALSRTAAAVPRTATASAAANASHRRRHFSASAARAENTAPPPPSSDRASTDTAYLGTKKRLPEFSLKDKVVLVSGGARGLGLTQTEALLEAGATVYALDRLPIPSPDFAPIQERARTQLGTALHYRQIDVRDVGGLNKVIADIGDAHGRLDGLIAAAGIQQETPALEYSAEDANRMFEVNVTGAFMTAQATAKQMIRFGNGGSIVMIASMSGTVANRGLICPAYNASKAGVIQLARNLASEWGTYGIRVNTISPGYIVTAMVEELFKQFPERRTDWPTQNMLGRLSAPEEYRGAGVFLISDASSFMTGADLRMDGGHAAW